MSHVPVTLPTIPMGAGIPRLLHQHFLDGEGAIPDRARAIQDALKRANPTWTYSFWDSARAEDFIERIYGDAILSRYRRIRREYYSARSDLLRYLTLYAQGGVYLDIKSTCDIPLDEAVRPDDKYLLMHFPWNMGHSDETRRLIRLHQPELADNPYGEFIQWAIVSVPGHPYLREVITRALANIDTYSIRRHGTGMGGVHRVTGPIAYTLAIRDVMKPHLHSGPMSAEDRGFRYTAFGDAREHRLVFGKGAHYGEMWGLQVVELGPVAATAAMGKRLLRRSPLAPVARRMKRLFSRGST